MQNWKYTVLKVASLQGACMPSMIPIVLAQSDRIQKSTENMTEWCLSMSVRICNKLGKTNFSDNLIYWLVEK